MRAENFDSGYFPEEPKLPCISYPPCEGCPYDPGEGFYCMGYCLKEIMESSRKGG